MGYYNPLLIYGEERVINAAKEAGANGFIIVDLPPRKLSRSAITVQRQGKPQGIDDL